MQTKYISCDNSTTTRKKSGYAKGSGKSQRLYVGKKGSYDYDAVAHFDFTGQWDDVGQVVSAYLILYTDDHAGLWAPGTSPKIRVKRTTGSTHYGTAADTVWADADYTMPAITQDGAKYPSPSTAANTLVRVDITRFADLWAPSSVLRSTTGKGAGKSYTAVALRGTTDDNQRAAFWSKYASDTSLRPKIELNYELSATTPNDPTNLSPVGAVASLTSFQADFSDTKSGDTLYKHEVNVQDASGNSLYTKWKYASATEILNARMDHIADGLHLKRNTTYKWRCRFMDQEKQTSAWTSLTSFSVDNTDPNAPNTTPTSATSVATLANINFAGDFSDPDSGDYLLAYQIQMSAYGSGDAHWDDPVNIKWDTGKQYVAYGSDSWSRQYGGASLSAGTYYWRARVWDNHDGVSSWTYQMITLTSDFVVDPGQVTYGITTRETQPWRIVIKDMGANRGPGNIVAILENAKSAGATTLWNSPGEAHWTLAVDHPQISVIEPKQTHYSYQFYTGDGWREKYAGLVWDFDATERDVIFYGIDYLALYDYTMDERYDPANPDLPNTKGGSKYVDKQIDYVVTDLLTRAKNLTNSPVGFITIGTIDTMAEKVTVYSTMAQTLQLVTGLMESHRAGADKRTRIQVRQTTGGGYEVVVQDDPGVARDNLRLRYGELVQGFRTEAFGSSWATRVNSVGRNRMGLKVNYDSAKGLLDESVYGRFARSTLINDIEDQLDLKRRTKQLAVSASMLGQHMGLGLKTGIIGPFDGYDITDKFPISIQSGAVNTDNYGHDGYWVCLGVTWDADDQGNSSTTLTLRPPDGGTAPSGSLLDSIAVNPQPEWQIGWTAPDNTLASSRYWYDASTGTVYERNVFADPTTVTTSGAGETIYSTGHGYSDGDVVYVLTMDGGDGLYTSTMYYVVNSTADTYQLSLTAGGAAVTFTSDIITAEVAAWPDYSVVVDGVMDAPSTIATPGAGPSLATATVGGVVKLSIMLDVPADTDVRLRTIDVEITHKYTDPGTGLAPDWDYAQTLHLVPGITNFTIPALPETSYASRQRYIDVYGNSSAWSTVTEVTTAAGNDALYASLADSANDVPDGLITETKIADNSITTAKIKANQITANLLAAEIVLATLFKTAADGNRRVEIDSEGIRLLDSDNGILVNIPTNGDPVYVAGDLVSSSLTALDETELRNTVSLAGGASMTLAQGISNPGASPSLSSSVPYLSLASTPPNLGRGLAYDSTNGYVWVGADPSASDYVAHAYNYSTGAYVGSLTKTGSFTTYTGTAGATSHISDGANDRVGSTDSHVATKITMPSPGASDGTLRITKVSVYMAGVGGTCDTRVCLWDDVSGTGNLVKQSDTFSAASKTFVNGNSVHYNKSLTSAYTIAEGATIYAGFRRMNTTDYSQWDFDSGSSKYTYLGDGTGGDGSGWGTYSSSQKPNVYVTYEYDVDTVLEGYTGKIIGVAVYGTYLWVLEEGTGKVYAYDTSQPWDSAYIGTYDMSSHMTNLNNASLFWDWASSKLYIPNASSATTGAVVKHTRCNQSAGALTYADVLTTTGYTFDGSASGQQITGGARSSEDGTDSWWIAIGNQVRSFAISGYAYRSNRDFGSTYSVSGGFNIASNSSASNAYIGYSLTYPTRVTKFTTFDWTSSTMTFACAYAWYSNTYGYVTKRSPDASITMRRRETLTISVPSLPGGDADRVRYYMYQGSAPAAGSSWLQSTTVYTTRQLTTYYTIYGHDSTSNTFPVGSSATISSDGATSGGSGWILNGDGTAQLANYIQPTGYDMTFGTGVAYVSSISLGDYAKIGTWQATGQYHRLHLIGIAHQITYSDAIKPKTGFVDIAIYQAAALPAQPIVKINSINIGGDDGFDRDQVQVVVTAATSSVTSVEIYIKAGMSYTPVMFKTLAVYSSGNDYVPVSGGSMVSSLPAGTVYSGVGQGSIWHVVGGSNGPSFANSWVNYGGGYEGAAYRMLPSGDVLLKGMIKSGTVGSAAFVLETGYRPSASVLLGTISNGAIGRVNVDTSGNVTPASPSSNAWVSLDGLIIPIGT